MTTKKIFTALIWPALMTYLKCQKNIAPFAMNTDITQFYARHAKIWTLKTTEYTTATCKVDLVDESTANYTQFDRQYYWIGSRVSNLLDGKFLTEPFTTDNNYNAMKVTQEDSTFASIEHLLQSYQNYSCGIFKVTVLSPDATKYYDLRTTKPTTLTCKLDIVYARTRNGIRFERKYYWFGSRINLYLEGTFMSKPIFKTTYNAMKVTKKDSIYKSIDHLLYSYRNYACGIFKVTVLHPEQTKYYELRVKDSAFVQPKPSCIERFENMSKGAKITTVYSSACKATRTL
ncbi:hypothetical protein MTO96_027329 [Rhipicephalus appendiculatus]